MVEAGQGSVNPMRAGTFGELLVNDAVGKYFELARAGHIYVASMQAGANLGTALTATAITFTLFNPPGSGMDIALLECAAVITTEPAVAAGAKAVLVYAANEDPEQALPTATTKLTVRPAMLGGQRRGRAVAFSAATLPGTPIIVRVHPLSLNNQSAVGGVQLAAVDKVDGAISLSPNSMVTVQGIATQAQGIISMVWAEIHKF